MQGEPLFRNFYAFCEGPSTQFLSECYVLFFSVHSCPLFYFCLSFFIFLSSFFIIFYPRDHPWVLDSAVTTIVVLSNSIYSTNGQGFFFWFPRKQNKTNQNTMHNAQRVPCSCGDSGEKIVKRMTKIRNTWLYSGYECLLKILRYILFLF